MRDLSEIRDFLLRVLKVIKQMIIGRDRSPFNMFRHLTDEEDWPHIDKLSSQSLLGSGSFGAVYLAKVHGENVAVKMGVTPNLSSHLRQLASLMSLLGGHPHLMFVQGVVSIPLQEPILQMDLMDGNLEKLLSLSPEQFLSADRLAIAYQIADGLNFLHEVAIFHMDLKPENVLVFFFFFLFEFFNNATTKNVFVVERR